MGEEKTAVNFILVSLMLLTFLLLYPTLVIVSTRTTYSNQQYSFAAITEILRFEKEMAKLNSFIVLYLLI
jgi:ABC-type Fe3+-citrate transport system substrate-binding protein